MIPMRPDTSPPPRFNASDAVAASMGESQPARPRPAFGSLIARILGVVIAILGSALVSLGVINVDSLAPILVLLGAVAMLAAVLLRTWWALLIVPVATTVGFCGTGLVIFLVAAAGHGEPDVREPGQLAVDLLVGVLLWGVLPALIGALAGTLAWRGWVIWRHDRAARLAPLQGGIQGGSSHAS